MMRVEVILENGEKSRFYLDTDELRKLEREVRKQKEYYRENGKQLNYAIGDEIYYAVRCYLKSLPPVPEE